MYHDEILKPTRFLNVVRPILIIKIHTKMPRYIYIYYIYIYNSYMRMPLQMHVLQSCIYFDILILYIYVYIYICVYNVYMYCIYLARLCVAHVCTESGAGNIYLLTYQVQTSAFTWSARPSGQHQQPNNLLTGTSGNNYEVTSDAMESPCNSISPTMATAGSDVSWTGNPLKRIVHWKMRPPFDRRRQGAYPICKEVIGN